MSLKTILFALAFTQVLPALGRDFIYHSQETQNLTEIRVQNKTRLLQPVWVLFYEDEFIEEHYFEVPALTTQSISLDGLKKPNWNFSVLSKTPQVRPIGEWDPFPSSRYEMKIKSFKTATLNIFNLYLEKQKVWFTYYDSLNKVISISEHKTASFRKNLSFKENIPTNAVRLEIESESPLLLTSDQVFKPQIATKRRAPSNFKYFLVQNGAGGSSFVAPIDDPKLISQARDEIINFQGYIVFADIELNTSQANRDFASPEKSFWSWSIKRVTVLNQIGADWCQAYPEMIERMLHGFLRQQSVCFRGQRIMRELKPSEVESGILNSL